MAQGEKKKFYSFISFHYISNCDFYSQFSFVMADKKQYTHWQFHFRLVFTKYLYCVMLVYLEKNNNWI